MEKTAYIIIGVLFVMWLGAILWGIVAAMPYGLIGLAAIVAAGLFFTKALKDRMANKEDDYYDKNVHQ